MRIGQTSFIAFGSKILSSAVGFIATIYFANVLGPEVLGDYYLLLSIVSWFALLGTMGVAGAITKRISEGDAPGEYKAAGAIIITTLMIVLVCSIYLLRGLIQRKLGIESIEFVILLLVVGLLSSYVSAVLQGVHLVHIDSILQPVRNATRAGVQAAGVFLSFGLTALVFGYAAGSIVLIAIGIYVLDRSYHLPSKHHFVSLLQYAKFSWLGRLEGRTINQADILVLGFFVPKTLVGVYGITWSIATFLIVFSTSITSSMFPEMSRLSNNENFEQVAVLAEDSLSYAGLITIPGLVGGILLGDRILQIYGEGFAQGAQVLGILIGSILFYGFHKQFSALLMGIDQPQESFKINATLIITNIVLNIILVSEFGIFGAAVASLSSTILGTITGFHLARKYIQISVPVRRISIQVAAALWMGIVVFLSETAIGALGFKIPNWMITVSLVIIGAVTYFSSLLAVSAEFRTTVIDNIPIEILFDR